ncbi:Yip1 family protein [Labrys wisconsinensis]|uniref:Yip1 domain-containing protein n=1 Tax=Labrys wisconsinensis TaxID=425677 RepID=A0ABU0JGX2_9HYPH|nr:Yip1 family protein [Labrys wisconsinensis]MDQ0473545.1 hypothetical protein [Labrys wisconsinensis]
MDIVGRAKAILMTPKAEWPVIDAEPTSVQTIYRDYLVYVAAVPAVAGLIGGLRGSFGGALATAILGYVLGLVGVYVLAVIVDKLAPTFGGTPNFLNAFKLSAYSATAAWLAGVFVIVPPLAILTILGLYSLYLLYVGLPVMMKSPADKTMNYTIAVCVVAFVLNLIIGAVVARIALA